MKKLMFVMLAAVLAGAANAEICIKNGDAIAFLGDSITNQGNKYPTGYVNLVMKGLEICGVSAKKIPAGIGGHKSVQMNARLDSDVISKKPQWMTFSCGVNDVWHDRKGLGVPLDKYKTLVSDIFDRCAAAGIEVIVLTATMITEDPEAKENKKLAAYNDWLRAEAKRRNLRIADLNAAMQAQLAEIRKTDKTLGNKLTRDGVHMAYDGNCMMAWGVLRAMGVDESMKDKIFAEFARIPGARSIGIDVSAEEYAAFEARAKAAGKSVKEFAKELLLK
jgi:lysophospholipase L1-like esterase